jgi:uncharacterized OsmC-like protein
MVKITATYEGEKHCELIHGPSNSRLGTDAPKDNNGKGELFSPTDLVAAATASCMLTVMAIASEKDGIPLKGSKASVEKEMTTNPRRISRLIVHLYLPKAIEPNYREKLETIANTCPVKMSLSKEMEIPVEFHYTL